MTDSFEKLALRLVDGAIHASYTTALVLVTLMALSVAALSLWVLVIVIRTVVNRRR